MWNKNVLSIILLIGSLTKPTVFFLIIRSEMKMKLNVLKTIPLTGVSINLTFDYEDANYFK